MKNWAPVNATLLHTSIDTRIGSTDSTYKTRHTYYSPNISYEYFVRNNRYIGNKVGWTKTYDTSNMLKKAQEYEYKFKNNQSIVVYVNPDKLSESVAIKNTDFSKVWFTVIVCLVFWSLLLGTGYLLKYKLKY